MGSGVAFSMSPPETLDSVRSQPTCHREYLGGGEGRLPRPQWCPRRGMGIAPGLRFGPLLNGSLLTALMKALADDFMGSPLRATSTHLGRARCRQPGTSLPEVPGRVLYVRERNNDVAFEIGQAARPIRTG